MRSRQESLARSPSSSTTSPPAAPAPGQPQDTSNSWLSELPTASHSLQIDLLKAAPLASPFGGPVAASPSKRISHSASAVHSVRKALSRSDTAHTSSATLGGDDSFDSANAEGGSRALDGEFFQPDWSGLQAFTSVHVPQKPSGTRYAVSMRSASLVPDQAVLSFLYAPAQHGHSLVLSDRVLPNPEADILGRLFSKDWHHACKLRCLGLNNMSLGDKQIKTLCK